MTANELINEVQNIALITLCVYECGWLFSRHFVNMMLYFVAFYRSSFYITVYVYILKIIYIKCCNIKYNIYLCISN